MAVDALQQIILAFVLAMFLVMVGVTLHFECDEKRMRLQCCQKQKKKLGVRGLMVHITFCTDGARKESNLGLAPNDF